MKPDELKIICDLVVKLTEIQIKQCGHTNIENFASKCLSSCIRGYDNSHLANINCGYILKGSGLKPGNFGPSDQ